MMKIKGSFRLLKQYIAYSLVAFMIPVVVIVASIYQSMIRIVAEEVQASNEQVLTQIRDIIDMRMRDLEQISVSISSNTYLTPYNLNRGGYDAFLSMRELANYKAVSSLVLEYVVHINGNKNLYSNLSICNVNTFINYICKFPGWDENSFVKYLESTKSPVIWPMEEMEYRWNKTGIITYIHPLPPGHGEPYGHVIYLIDESSFSRLIDGVFREYTGSVFILDRNGKKIASSGNDERLKEKENLLLEGSRDNNQRAFTIDVDGEEYSVLKLTSEYNGWSYMTVMPSSQFMSKVIKTREVILQTAVFVLLLSISLAIMSAILNYRPIHKVTGRLPGTFQKGSQLKEKVRYSARLT